MSEDFKTKYWFALHKFPKNHYPVSWDDFPNRIRLSNGNTKTDKETFTEEDIKDAGYKFVDVYPNYNDETHICYWKGSTNEWILHQYYWPEAVTEDLDD
tara:strand:- start:200 stop:496 length:297 start_codon:yes stop_codon:yes gene_type:complete